MAFILLLLAIFAFVWYYKNYMAGQSSSTFQKFTRASKGFGKSFAQGIYEQRLDEYKRKMNYYVVALLAKIAKSDGRVSQSEADMITQILNANASDEKERAFLKASFNEHKNELNDTQSVAYEFMREVPLPQNERLNVLRMFVYVASIDGVMNDTKIKLLSLIASAFGVSTLELESFIASFRHSSNSKELSLDEAYKVLELDKNADINELKKRYRALAKKYHPDILNANNVSEAELKQGAAKFQEINEAYEKLKKYLEN
ncbi:molecular chaperone DjlA [Campylobacter sp. MIT 12-8780]|uniref:TerB family tellurite resistance protein n=1 Tax=unclassified Campylobacter TaxID=2593542 RepID=UPI00115EC3DD|nr:MULTISPECIES: DnaJ domain-containing protein [unclassified Campylobacter]NDJ26402.1 DnaJ domain-containing protein [Campylobacter sp. MIT 19-121]TQR42979.1 molecular chaperone DjlA [Campylobacter sp. MIT 12-8780]